MIYCTPTSQLRARFYQPMDILFAEPVTSVLASPRPPRLRPSVNLVARASIRTRLAAALAKGASSAIGARVSEHRSRKGRGLERLLNFQLSFSFGIANGWAMMARFFMPPL